VNGELRVWTRSQICEKQLLTLSRLSVRPSAWNKSSLAGRIFMNIDIWLFFEYLSRIFNFHKNRTKITVNLREDQCTFSIISLSFLLKMRNVSGKSCTENLNIFCVQQTFFPEKHSFYEIMWKNIVESGRAQMTIWRTRTPCWITKATKIHWECVALTDFPLQKCLH
jgi:hypothetical protein